MVLWKRSTVPLVCGLLALVRVWSMSSTARELIFVTVVGPAIFGPAVGEHALQGNGVLLIERDHRVVEQVCGGERVLRSHSLAKPTLA
jgi:hypothetical protein